MAPNSREVRCFLDGRDEGDGSRRRSMNVNGGEDGEVRERPRRAEVVKKEETDRKLRANDAECTCLC